MEDKLCFVQFLHPGRERLLDVPGLSGWTPVAAGHARKYIRASGRFLQNMDGDPIESEIGFWGEWEAPSEAEAVSNPIEHGPGWIHRPVWSHQPSYRGLQNTDPFVFGDRFHYTGCLQHTVHGPTQLRNLARGSVILFGSKRAGRDEFTIDTVFVVAEYIDHSSRNYRRALKDKVSDTYEAVTLGPWYDNMTGCSAQEANRSYRLYFGATPEHPVAGMFSFFPCASGDIIARGFARPAIHILDVITPSMTQNKRLNPKESTDEIVPLWDEVIRQVIEQGLFLGVHAALPGAH